MRNKTKQPHPAPVEPIAGRGEYLGRLYIARRKCGKVSAMCWDDPEFEKSTAKDLASYTKRGDSVECVERYENDPQPEWICRPSCNDCMAPNETKPTVDIGTPNVQTQG